MKSKMTTQNGMNKVLKNIIGILITGGISLSSLVSADSANAHCTLYHPHHCNPADIDPGKHIRTNYQVHIKNTCHKTIWVAIKHYTDVSNSSSVGGYEPNPWSTEGWWKLSPGEQAHLLNTKNRWIYLYAEDKGRKTVWTGNKQGSGKINGRRIKMTEVNMGSRYSNYYHTFRC